MSGSWKVIDYRVRPAKSIERKMLAETFRRLSEFSPLSDYRYVGMGSLYFSDFKLFHKAVGFESMVSIENVQDSVLQQRFHMNVPFGNVEMRFGHSSVILQKLPWSQRTVAWMDYDGTLVADCLSDIDYIVRHAASGSIVLLSVNAGNLTAVRGGSDDEEDSAPTDPLTLLKAAIGAASVPVGVESRDLSGAGVAKVYRQVVQNVIDEALRTRNALLEEGQKFKYRQIYNFHYKDGVRMMTVGGILYSDVDEAKVNKCAFDQLDFTRDAELPYSIDPPNLTYMEMRQIDALRRRPSVSLPLPTSDVRKYEQTYRFFPNYMEAEAG